MHTTADARTLTWDLCLTGTEGNSHCTGTHWVSLRPCMSVSKRFIHQLPHLYTEEGSCDEEQRQPHHPHGAWPVP